MSDKQGLTSVEAASLILSEGRTKDPTMANAIASGNDLDMDALQRSHLTRMMGFEFDIKLRPNKIHVMTRNKPYLTTTTKVNEGDIYDGRLTNEDVVDRLVEACLRLKLKVEANK